MTNITENGQLVLDIVNFFRSFGHILQSSPLFVQVFDLQNDSQIHNTPLMTIGSTQPEVTKESPNAFELDLDSVPMI